MDQKLVEKFGVLQDQLSSIINNEDVDPDIRAAAGRLTWDISEDYYILTNLVSHKSVCSAVYREYDRELMGLYSRF